MIYTISKDVPPEDWDGKFCLECTHSYNSRSQTDYLMYCNVLKKMPNNRVKIKVFGNRWHNTKGEKIRYTDEYRLIKIEKIIRRK